VGTIPAAIAAEEVGDLEKKILSPLDIIDGDARNENNRQIRDLLKGAGMSDIQPHPPK
jgi:hypothetical protein